MQYYHREYRRVFGLPSGRRGNTFEPYTMCGWHAPARHLFYCLKGSEGKELENKYPVVLSLHPPSASPQIALHVLLPSESDQMLELYHNRQLQPLRDIAVEFLFSRFAW
ncbi:hypothetical protein ACKVWC_010451 [Pyricularia oryzae]